MHSPKLRFAILGYGKHSAKVMHPAFSDSSRTELVAIATESKEKFDSLSLLHPKLGVFNSYKALLESNICDAVYIGLPNHLHAQWSIEAMRHGKHVLCDKPLAVSSSEVSLMQAVSAETERKLFEGFMYRFHPQHQKVFEIIKENSLGDLRLLEIHFHYHLLDRDNIRLKKDCAGGGLYDVGCYAVDCARFLLSKNPISVFAHGKINEETGVDESLSAVFTYDDGLSVQFTVGTTLLRESRYALYGTKGVVHVEPAFVVPRNMKASVLFKDIEGSEKRFQIEAKNQYALELDYFASLVAGEAVDERLTPVSLENARVIEALFISLRTGKSAKVSEIDALF